MKPNKIATDRWFVTCPQGAVIDPVAGTITRGGCGWRGEEHAPPRPAPDVDLGACPICGRAVHVEPVVIDEPQR